MAAAEGRLRFSLDENSGALVDLLRQSRAESYEDVVTLAEVGIEPGALDPNLLKELGSKGRFAFITRDGKMIEPMIQRSAWRESRVTLFLLGRQWGTLKLGEQARRFLFVWPQIVAHARDGGQGVAWRVAPRVPAVGTNTFRLVTGLHASFP
ncbi:hypothetical protein [Elioraea sp.]|uniref:PIN-like domain-containing protein n=1 Tax=Elioraea sp. TaxID=2185103 RepID=UPI00307E49A9